MQFARMTIYLNADNGKKTIWQLGLNLLIQNFQHHISDNSFTRNSLSFDLITFLKKSATRGPILVIWFNWD